MTPDTVAVVTGASRGAGLGIAHALGSHGCTVYVTGRTEKAGESSLGGTIHETAELVTSAGGKGIAVHVDHADDEQTKALFEQVETRTGQARHPGEQRRDHPRRNDGPDPLLGGAHQRHRHARCRPAQQLRRHRLWRSADASATPRTGRVHLGPGCGPLRVRPVLRRTQGGNGQDGRGHGGRLQGIRHRGGVHLDGCAADRTSQEHRRRRARKVRATC